MIENAAASQCNALHDSHAGRPFARATQLRAPWRRDVLLRWAAKRRTLRGDMR